MEGGCIFAQNAIRENNQSRNYLSLSTRIDKLAARVEQAIRMSTVNSLLQVLSLMVQVTSAMADVGKSLELVSRKKMEVSSRYLKRIKIHSRLLV